MRDRKGIQEGSVQGGICFGNRCAEEGRKIKLNIDKSFALRSSLRINSLATLCFCTLLLASCAEKPPIPEKKFSDIYVALQLLDAQFAAHPTVEKAKVDSLLRTFKANDSLIDAELSWYSKNPEHWQTFFANVQEKLKGERGAYVKVHP